MAGPPRPPQQPPSQPGRPDRPDRPDRPPATPAGQAAAAAVLALARTARSFTLYDPENQAIRQLLADFQARTRAALERHGILALDVRPYEIAVGDEVVYRDTDREKSLAFKLYRDGVRKLEISPAVPWEELLRLVEILALAYTFVRQREDDVVMLMDAAEFRGIRYEAIEGYTPDEERPEPDVAGIEKAHAFRPPVTWDTPLPPLPQPGPLEFRPIPPELLGSLRAEAATGEGDELALAVARDLLAEAGRAGWPSPDPDLLAFLSEVRDALLAEAKLGALRQLLDLLGTAGGTDLREELLARLGDARTLELVLAAVPDDAARLPPDLVPFLPLLGIGAALDQLAGAVSEGRRRLLVQLVLARMPREVDAVLPRLHGLDPRVARDLTRGIAARAPERAVELARQVLGQPDESLRLEALQVLEFAPGDVPLRPIAELLRDPAPSVRERAAEVLGRRGDESVVPAIRAALEDARQRSYGEAEALGRAMARLAPIAAARLFAEWIDVRARFLRAISAERRWQQWAAVAGMGALPGTDPEPTLTALAERADDDLKKHCQATLLRRRKELHAAAPRG